MGNLMALEWLKLRKRPMLLIWLTALTILGAGWVFLSYIISSSIPDNAPRGGQLMRSTLTSGALLPGSIIQSMNVVIGFGCLALAVIAALSIGQEFSWGTIRLMLTRGTGRINLWVSKIVLLLIISFVFSVVGVVIGVLFGLLNGVFASQSPGEFGSQAIQTILLQLGVGTLNMWTFALLGVLAATFFRSAIAGVIATLGYMIAETILNPLLIFASQQDDGLLRFLGGLRYFFIGNNTASLQRNANPARWGTISISLTSIDGWAALTYVAIFCTLCLGLSLWIIRSRDVTD